MEWNEIGAIATAVIAVLGFIGKIIYNTVLKRIESLEDKTKKTEGMIVKLEEKIVAQEEQTNDIAVDIADFRREHREDMQELREDIKELLKRRADNK